MSHAGMAGGQNIFERSSSGLYRAGQGTNAAMGYRPMTVQGQSYNPALNSAAQYGVNGTPYNPVMASAAGRGAFGYDPSTVNAGSYDAAQLANTNLDPYMNPYTSNVIDQSLSDIDRARQMASNQTDAQATAAGAFGGSRQALMQTENNRNFLDQSARTASGLRQAGFQNAQGMALQDIGARNQASQYNLGLDMQGQLANQQAQNQASQFSNNIDANQYMQAEMANQNAQNQALSSGFQSRLQGDLANQAARNDAARFNSSQDFQAQMQNQNAGLNGAQFRLGAANQMGNLANLGFGMGNQMNQALAGQAANRRQIEQGIINDGRGQFNQYTGAPAQGLAQYLSAIGGTPYSQTNTKNNGLLDYLTVGASMVGMSDVRLKDDIQKIGNVNGHNIYQWSWKRDDIDQPAIGVLAQEVQEYAPEAVMRGSDGYLRVSYGMLFGGAQ